MKMPCQSINAPYCWSTRGVFRVAPLTPNPPAMGGIIIDGNTWTVSRMDPTGIDVSANLLAVPNGATLTIETPTGSNQLVVSSQTAGPDSIEFVGVQSNAVGIIYGQQITGLFMRHPAPVRCVPTVVVTTRNYCIDDRAGTLAQYLAEHPDEVQIAAAYIQENCPPPPPPPPYCEWTAAEMAAFVDSNPDMADEVYCYLRDNCPDCETINWLLGYLSARDPETYTPGEDA